MSEITAEQKRRADLHATRVVIDRPAPVLVPGEHVIRRQGRSRFGEPEEER